MKNALILIFIITLAACAGGGGGGSGTDTAAESLCSQSKVQGTWNGTINGQPDSMTIDAQCNATSSYCGSQSIVAFYTVEKPCSNTSYQTCGTGRITVNTGNNNTGCVPTATHVDCDFSVDTPGNTLRYHCGNGIITYTK